LVPRTTWSVSFAIALGVLPAARPAAAQDLDPRANVRAPINSTVAIAGFSFSQGSVFRTALGVATDTGPLSRAVREGPAVRGLRYNPLVEKADLRRWVDNRRAVARLEQAHLTDAWGPPAQAIAAALSLIALEGRLHGWPPPPDPVTDREDHAMWERFARLRARFVRR
jgi:hypothetical protein